MFRRKPKPLPEDYRTAGVLVRLENVAERLERMTRALEAQIEAEEAIDADGGVHGDSAPA